MKLKINSKDKIENNNETKNEINEKNLSLLFQVHLELNLLIHYLKIIS